MSFRTISNLLRGTNTSRDTTGEYVPPSRALIRAAVIRGVTTRHGTLLKPRDIDRVTRELMNVLDNPNTYTDEDTLAEFHTGHDITVMPAWDNVDRVLGEVGDLDAIRRGQGGAR